METNEKVCCALVFLDINDHRIIKSNSLYDLIIGVAVEGIDKVEIASILRELEAD